MLGDGVGGKAGDKESCQAALPPAAPGLLLR